MGYFSQDALAALVKAEAFFLGRFQTQTALYIKTEKGDYKRLSLWEILRQPSQESVREVPVFLGAKAFLPCRFIIQRLPEEEVKKRKRRLRARAKKKGKTLSKEKLALCSWNLYVTNADSLVFPARVVPLVYSLRRQIELVFKAIKSHLGFELIAGKREARICCQLYGRLIVLVLSLFLTGQFRRHLWRRKKRELSLLKTFAHLPIVAPMILAHLRNPIGLLTTLKEVADEIMTSDWEAPKPSPLNDVEWKNARHACQRLKHCEQSLLRRRKWVSGEPHFPLSPFPPGYSALS